MSVSAATFEAVRARANYACEYCGVTETDAHGLLTIDHFRPTSRDGDDDPVNLIYACFRCNLYKSDFWPADVDSVSIWNPRNEPASNHLFELEDGRILALTETGRETIHRLRLNRPPLVDARVKKRKSRSRSVLITRLAEITASLALGEEDRARLVAEENALLVEQRQILAALWSLEG